MDYTSPEAVARGSVRATDEIWRNDRKRVEELVARLRKDDTEGWSYQLAQRGSFYGIEVFDETGASLGYL